MKLAILIALDAVNKKNAVIVAGPVPYDDGLALFKAAVAAGEIPDVAAKAGCNILELWTKFGRQKHHSWPHSNPGPSRPAPVAAVAPAKPVAPAATAPAPASGLALDAEPAVDPVLAIAARLQAGEEVTPEELGALTVEQLRTLGERYDIPMPASAKKSELVELLLAKEEE